MGPSNPWSPNWRPDPTGSRLLRIRVARRGAWLAAAIYLPIATVAAALAADPVTTLPTYFWAPFATIAILSGVAGVALLGAGLAPAALGSRIDAVVVAIAIAIGAPVGRHRVVGDLGLGDRFLDGGEADLAAPFLRAGVLAAVRVAPLVAAGAAGLGPDPAADQPAAAGAAARSAVGVDRTVTSSPRRIRPGRSTSASTPKSACLPSRRPRYEMIVRSVSRSTLAGVRMLRRDRAAGVGLGHPQDRVADRRSGRRSTCPPRAASAPWRSMSIRKRRASTASTPAWRASSRSDPSETMLVGLPARVPPGRSQRTTRIARPAIGASASPHGPMTTWPTPVRPWIGRLDGLAELHLVLDDRAVRERHPQHRRLGVGVGRDLHEPPDDDPVDEAVRLVGQVEPAVLDDAALGDVDLGRVLEGEAAHGRDREAGDARHARMLPDDDVPDRQRRAWVELEDVEHEDGLDAFDALAPAVLVDVPDRLAVRLRSGPPGSRGHRRSSRRRPVVDEREVGRRQQAVREPAPRRARSRGGRCGRSGCRGDRCGARWHRRARRARPTARGWIPPGHRDSRPAVTSSRDVRCGSSTHAGAMSTPPHIETWCIVPSARVTRRSIGGAPPGVWRIVTPSRTSGVGSGMISIDSDVLARGLELRTRPCR